MAKAPRLTPQDGSQNKVPIAPSLIDRVVQGVRYVLTGEGPNAWFGPGQPLAPQAQNQPGVAGRQFDFPVNTNARRTPRDNEAVSFADMRALADNYDLLRLVIETRKDQMEKLKWSFSPIDPKAQADDRCKQLEAFFKKPDGEHEWNTWLRALLEDMLVVDAATLYPRPTLGGELFALELLDGTTIKRVLDPTGRTPQPPDVAYQQVLKGMSAVDYHADELIYKPRNVRTHKVYGYSPVEQIIVTVNIAIRRQIHQLQYYTEGNIPEAMVGTPEDWNPDQIRQFQEYWDSLMEGNTAQRRHAKFVPGGQTYTPTREPELKGEFDEWLARIICFAFSISPQALVKMMNRATADTAQEVALAEGLLPMMNWVKNLIDYVLVKYFGITDIEFKWIEEDDTAPLVQAQILQIYTGNKPIMTLDEARDKLGLDAATPEQLEQLRPPPPPPPDPNKPGAALTEGSTDKPVGKLHGSGLRKVSSLPRNRASTVESTRAIEAIVVRALRAAGKRISKDWSAELGKAVRLSPEILRLLAGLRLPELEDAKDELIKALEAMLEDGGREALRQVLDVSTFSEAQLEQVHARAVSYAKERAAELIKSLEDSTQEMLRSTVVTGLEEGWSVGRMASELEQNYGFSDARAATIARTETAYADVQGNLEGYKASGVVQSKRWIIAQDEYCDDCNALDGVVVDLDEDFPDGGGDGPPLHPNCRCDVVPVLAGS